MGFYLTFLRFNLVFGRSEFANVRPPEQVILHEDVPHRTVVRTMILYNLSCTFFVDKVIKDDGNSLRSVDHRHVCAPLLPVAEDGLPVSLGV